jgi:hypothetical protein
VAIPPQGFRQKNIEGGQNPGAEFIAPKHLYYLNYFALGLEFQLSENRGNF